MTILGLLVLFGILGASVPAGAGLNSFEQIDLLGGRKASLDARGGRVQFARDAALTGLADPRCPSRVALRWRTATFDSGERWLDCGDWMLAKRTLRFVPSLTAGAGVESIEWKGTSLEARLGGDGYSPPAGEPGFLEVALTIGPDGEGFGPNVYCGRFAATEAGGGLSAVGPSEPCDPIGPPTRVGTATPSGTPTPTAVLPTATTTATVPPAATPVPGLHRYRVAGLTVLDPHLFLNGTADLTAVANIEIGKALGADGTIELGLVAEFDEASGLFTLANASCASLASCATGAAIASAAYFGQSTGSCVAPNPSAASNPVPGVSAPCVSTAPAGATLTLAGIRIPLQAARLHAEPPAAGVPQITGVLGGFLAESDAQGTSLPSGLPLIGGKALSSLLRTADRDVGPDGTTPGWWFYLGVSATRL